MPGITSTLVETIHECVKTMMRRAGAGEQHGSACPVIQCAIHTLEFGVELPVAHAAPDMLDAEVMHRSTETPAEPTVMVSDQESGSVCLGSFAEQQGKIVGY